MAGTKKEMELVKKEMESMSDVEVTAANEDDIAFRLTDERRKRLEEVDFVWSAREGEKGTEQGRITRNSYDDQWDQMFARLQEYKEKSGDCLVPKRHKEDPKLGTWVDTQRVQFKKMKKKLEEQGITYEGPEDAKQAKYEDEDDNSTSSNPSQDSKPVVGRLTDDRIRRLENLGFVWSLRDDWQKHYLELKQYKEEHGHCNVSLDRTKVLHCRHGVCCRSQEDRTYISRPSLFDLSLFLLYVPGTSKIREKPTAWHLGQCPTPAVQDHEVTGREQTTAFSTAHSGAHRSSQ